MRRALRWGIYALLLLPPGYIIAITFPEKRVGHYLRVLYLLGPLALLWAFHALALRWWPAYRRRTAPIAGPAARAMHVLATTFAFVLVFPAGLIYSLIGLGLAPAVFLGLTVLVGTALGIQHRLGDRYPRILRLDLVVVLFLYFYVAMATVAATYLGSRDATCHALEQDPFLVPIVTRQDIEGSGIVSSCFPYDVKSDPAADRLFFTLKERRSGFVRALGHPRLPSDAICATRLSAPRLDPAMTIPILGPSTATYPQRITVRPARKEVYVVVLDIDGAHSVRVISYAEGWRTRRSIPLDYEPIRVYLDDARGRLLILGYEGWVGVYDAETEQRLAMTRLARRGWLGLIDTFARDPARDVWYASVVSSRFLKLAGDDFRTLASRRIGSPTIGADYDPETDQVFAAGTLTREILVLDGPTLAVKRRVFTGITARELAIDRRRRLVVTGGYVDGHVDFYDLATMRRRARTFVGKLARGLHIEQESGRVFVASGCGLWEIRVDALLAAQRGTDP